MRTTCRAAALTAFALFTGCSSLLEGADLRHKDLFRQQIAQSVPVKHWGYKVQDIRLSDDSHRVLIVLLAPGSTFNHEVVLNDDGFRRYTGGMIDLVRQAEAKSSDPTNWHAFITLTLPDTLPAYRHESEFREQVEAAAPVQKWGYKIQDIRFNANYKKALVVFKEGGRFVEVTLEDDGFRRFQGKFTRPIKGNPSVAALEAMARGKPINTSTSVTEWLAFDAESQITVTLPDK